MAVTAHDGAQHSSAARSATKFRLARRSEENRRACSSPFHRALQLDRTGQNCYPTCPAQAYLDRCGQTTGSSLQRWPDVSETTLFSMGGCIASALAGWLAVEVAGAISTSVHPHRGALLEDVAGQGEPLASITGIQFPAGRLTAGRASVADQRVLAVWWRRR